MRTLLMTVVAAGVVAGAAVPASASTAAPTCKKNVMSAARPPLDLSPIAPASARRLKNRTLPTTARARARRCLLPSFVRAGVSYRALATTTTSVRAGGSLSLSATGLLRRRGEDARVLLAGARYGTENALPVRGGRASTTLRIPVHAPAGIYYLAVADLAGQRTADGPVRLHVTRLRVR